MFARAAPDASALRLPVQTVADKCAWAPQQAGIAYCAVPETLPSRAFLGPWYRGEVHTTDALWRVDAINGTAERFYTPDPGKALDVFAPTINDAGTYLALINATDMTPWLLRLEQ